MPGMSYEQKEITLKPGECVLLYSDGLVEAHDPRHEMFGTPRMQGFVGAHPGGATLIDSLLAGLEQFTGEQWEQEDDYPPGYPEEIGTVGFTACSQASRMLPSSAWLKRYVKLHPLPDEPGAERDARGCPNLRAPTRRR
jgi:hypothetical protein